MTVALVNVGDKFGPEYDEAWASMLDRHFRFADTLLIKDSRWPGWWSKMELFSDELFDLRPFLFFDLDTFVLSDVSDLIDLAENTKDFWMLRDLTNPTRSNSGVMIIPKVLPNHSLMAPTIAAIPSDVNTRNPDGAFLARFPHRQLQDEIPGIVSYKADCADGPAGRIVCFHGVPKPHEVVDGWAADKWRELTS
jgi:hypothetical protein